MKLYECMELGRDCGLNTIEECYDNVEMHCGCLFRYEDTAAEFAELQNEIKEKYPEKYKEMFGEK